MSYDPRFISGLATLVIGAFVCAIPLRLWFLHPVNRVFNLGPFVTIEGMRTLLNHRSLLMAIGLCLLVNGTSRIIFALRWQQYVSDDLASIVGNLEAGFSIWAATMALIGARRIWFRK